jgi:hypothetical protein
VKFLKHYKFSALCSAGTDAFLESGDIPWDVLGAVLLHHSNF